MTPLVWKRHGSVGDVEVVKGMGGIAAPLLAGFCLTTIAVLVTAADHKNPTARHSVVFLVLAAGAFLASIQFAFLAVRYGSKPSEYLDWQPDAVVHPHRLQELRFEQAADRKLFERYFDLAGGAYDLGLLAFLLGLVAMIIPEQWHIANRIAVGVAVLALAIEVVWMVNGHWRIPGLGRRFFPMREDLAEDVVGSVDEIPRSDLEAMGLRVEPTRTHERAETD
jgi:hypothetical protein